MFTYSLMNMSGRLADITRITSSAHEFVYNMRTKFKWGQVLYSEKISNSLALSEVNNDVHMWQEFLSNKLNTAPQ